MLRRTQLVLGTLTFCILLMVTLLIPIGLDAAPYRTADFQPTMSRREAQARIAAAQAQLQNIEPATIVDDSNLPRVQTLYFTQTGHHLSNRSGFLDFWRANGQLLIFGYPISEELLEDGRVVQYFERARFEYHPEHSGTAYAVQLELLGYAASEGREFAAVADPADGRLYFPQTGHTLGGEFRRYWQKRGGLAIFGFPISEEFEEQGRVVQYFERARFEYNPEDMAAFYRGMESYNGLNLDTLYEVQLGLLGQQVAQQRGISTGPVARLSGVRDWSPRLWERQIVVSLSEQYLYAYEGGLMVYRAPVATGRDGFNTPVGEFAIYDKLAIQTMAGSAGGESWYVPDIPSVMYVVGGVALHGTYWHDRHGTGVRMSHGCINLMMDDARWIYEWADIGVPVTIQY